MKRVYVALLVVFFSTTLFAGKIRLRKDEKRLVPQTYKPVKLYEKFKKVKDGISIRFFKPTKQEVDTIQVLAIRVEFVEDDDSRTTGNGKMDFEGNGEVEIDTIICEGGECDTFVNAWYDGPHTKAYFEQVLECCKNYYLINSFGNLVIDYEVFPEGDSSSYQLPHTMLYYGDPDNMELGLATLVRDAIVAACKDSTLKDSIYTKYDALIIFHAGSCWQTDLMWDSDYDLATSFVPEGALEYYLGDASILGDLYGATIMPEMARQDGIMFGIEGQMCHEFSHELGLPDLYDVSGWSMGVGAWDIMGYGGWLGDPLLPPGRIPSLHSAWAKIQPYEYLYWVDPLVIESETTNVSIFCSEMDTSRFSDLSDKNLVVKIPINGSEYFLIENRQADPYTPDTIRADMEMGIIVYVENGEYDFFLPGNIDDIAHGGLLIWHIDEKVIEANWEYNTVNANRNRKGVDLEEADGVQDFDKWVEGSYYEIYGSPFDPFFKSNNDSFTPYTNPNTNDNDGGYTGICIYNISESDTVMTFDVRFHNAREGFPAFVGSNETFYTNSINIANFGIVFSSTSGKVYAYDKDGNRLFVDTTSASIFSSPAVGDIDGDGNLEIVVGDLSGQIYAWEMDGTLCSGFPIELSGKIYSSPSLGDIDGDDTLDIVIGTDDMFLYAISNDTIRDGFPVFMGDVVRSSPALADLDGDEICEIIALSGDGRLFVLKGNGSNYIEPMITERLGPSVASPVVGDIDSDDTLEIVAVTSAGYVYCFDAYGNEEDYWPREVEGTPIGSPALGDLDRDGYLEVVLISGNKLYAFNHNGSICNNFPVELKCRLQNIIIPWVNDEDTLNKYVEAITSSPVLADINKDGYLEIIFGAGTKVYAYHWNGKKVYGFPLGCGDEVYSTPAVCNLDGDNSLELLVLSEFQGDTLIDTIPYGRLHCWELYGDTSSVVWGLFRGDPAHTGVYTSTIEYPAPTISTLLSHVYNYPNPIYGGRTTIRYFLAQRAEVNIKIFNIAGELVGEYSGTNTPKQENEVSLDVSRFATGLYIFRVEAKTPSKTEIKLNKFAIIR